MAPRKSGKISAPKKTVQAVPMKLSGKRQKRIQSLKVPNQIIINIPAKPNGLDVPDTLKKVDGVTKIALANEVARSQILKVPIEVRVEPPKTRGRNKKVVVSEFFNKTDGATDKTVKVTEAADSAVKKVIKKQSPAEMPPKRKILTRKKADSVKKPIIKRQKIVKVPVEPLNEETKAQEDAFVEKVTTKPDTTAKESIKKKPDEKNSNLLNEPTTTKNRKRNLCLKSKMDKVVARQLSPILQTRCIKRPKLDNPCDKTNKKPCISTTRLKLQNNESAKQQAACTKSLAKDIDTLNVNKPGQVNSRKNSISSCSNLSWTRDISSSSTTNSIIVSSNDYVRFNKKLPFIKLTNIDDEVYKYKATPIADERNDTFGSLESESYLSNARLSQTSPSRESTNSEEVNMETSSNINKDFGKAAENLMHVLKKIDIEFINWIHETDYISSDLNKIKDKLFDILKSELCALTHCRKLQEISNSDAAKDDSICNEEINESNKRINSLVHNQITNNKANTISYNEAKTNVGKQDQLNKIGNNRTDPIKPNNVVSNNFNTYECVKSSGSNKYTTVERKKQECHKSNTFNHTMSENNNIQIVCSVSNNGIENNKIDLFDRNKIIGDKFKSNTLENIKSNKFGNIRIEFDRSGTKKVAYDSPESNKIIYSKVETRKDTYSQDKNIEVEGNNVASNSEVINKDTNSPVETNKIASTSVEDNGVTCNPNETNKGNESNPNQNSVQSKLDEEMTRPGTSGIELNKFNDPRTPEPCFSSETSDSGSSSDSETSIDEKCHLQSPQDDDDALSLFAESITGMESSRINTSVISAPTEKQIEEYIPVPIQNKITPPTNYTYCPTKISEQVKNAKIVCEKQNADSTSIYKDKDANPVTPMYQRQFSSLNTNEIPQTGISFEVSTPNDSQRSGLIQDFVQTRPGDINIVFRGYCYLNLMHRCSFGLYGSKPCRFSHEVPSEQEIRLKICTMDKETFTKQYILLRRKGIMLRRFGLIFLYECARRNYTRMLVEMAYDFITKLIPSNELCETIKMTTVEVTLLHLNEVDLSVCEDILLLRVDEVSLLCDVFMQMMARTQNFLRFKKVFLSLTYFLVNSDRTFSLKVTDNLLERLCILPFDEPLARAFIQIMRLTNPNIFQNSIIKNFEKQISVNKEVSEEYWSLKKEVSFVKNKEIHYPERVERSPIKNIDPTVITQTVAQSEFYTPVITYQTIEPPQINRPEGVPLPPSPDTTHLDFMNKTAEEPMVPKITRTLFGLNPGACAGKSPRPSNSQEVLRTPCYTRWNNRSIFHQIKNRASFSSPRQSRPNVEMLQMRKQSFDGQRLVVTLGGSHMFPPPRPDY